MYAHSYPFDPIGQISAAHLVSRFESYKDALLYNVSKYVEVTDEQMTKISTDEDDPYNLTKEQNNIIVTAINSLYSYILSFKNIDDFLAHIGVNYEFNQLSPSQSAPSMKKFHYNGRSFKEQENFIKKPTLDINYEKNLHNTMKLALKDLINSFRESQYNRDAKILNYFTNYDYGNIDNNSKNTVVKLLVDYQRFFQKLSAELESWKTEFKNAVTEQIQEAIDINRYVLGIKKYHNTRLDYKINLESFKDFIINTDMTGKRRKEYFKKNRYHPQIFTAKVGGKSIIKWYAELVLNLKDPKDYTQDVIDKVGNEWLSFLNKCGYNYGQNEIDYISYVLGTELPYVQTMIETERTYKLKQQIDTLEGNLKKVQLEKDIINDQLKAIVNERDRLQLTNTSYQNTIELIKTQNKDLEDKIKNIEKQITDDENEHKTLQQKLKDLTDQKKDFEDKKNKFVKELSDLQTRNKTLMNEIADLKKQKIETETKITNINQQITDKNNEIETLQTENTRLQNEIVRLENMNKYLNDQLALAQNDQINNIKTELDKLSNIIKYQYDDNKTVKQNIDDIQTIITQEITDRNKSIMDNNNIINQLQLDKENLSKQMEEYEEDLKDIFAQILHKEEIAESQRTTMNIYRSLIKKAKKRLAEVDEYILNAETQKAELEQKIREKNDLIENYKQQILDNNSTRIYLEEQIEVINKRIEGLNEKERELKKKEVELTEKENEIQKQIQELKDIEKSLIIEVIPKGVDEIEDRLIRLLYRMGVYPDMSIKTFREMFIEDIMKSGINIEIPKIVDNDNSILIYKKSVLQWYNMYQQRLKNLKPEDFNPDGVMFKEVRDKEIESATKFIDELVKNNTLYDLNTFIASIIDHGIVNPKQKRYFKLRLSNKRICETIIGDRTIDHWYNGYLVHFFKGYNENEEKDRFI